MARRCVGGNLTPEGQGSWQIPALPNDDGGKQCLASGGSIEEDDEVDACGASSASTGQMVGSQSSAMSLTSAVLNPVRRVRDIWSDNVLVRSLAAVNDSPELLEIVMSKPAIAAKIAEGIGFLSTVCTAVLAKKAEDPLLRLSYDEGLHKFVTDLAVEVRENLKSDYLRASLDQALGVLEAFVGMTFGSIASELNRDSAATAS